MRRAGAWQKALTQWTFWVGVGLRIIAPVLPLVCIGKGGAWTGGEDAGIYCAENLGEWMVWEGLILLVVVIVGYLFEFTVRIMGWAKAPFVFTPLILAMGLAHTGIWSYGWIMWNRSLPAMDYTWTFTSEDEEAYVGEQIWGSPTPAPTPAGTFGGYGCQEELVMDFFAIQATLGVVGFCWTILLWKLATHVPKVVDKDKMKELAMKGRTVKGVGVGEVGGDEEEGGEKEGESKVMKEIINEMIARVVKMEEEGPGRGGEDEEEEEKEEEVDEEEREGN